MAWKTRWTKRSKRSFFDGDAASLSIHCSCCGLLWLCIDLPLLSFVLQSISIIDRMGLPTVKEIHNAKAGPCWNILCCPLVMTIGMLFRSITIFCLPCLRVLSFRFVHSIWKYCCCCFTWPYEDEAFIGASALGDFSVEGKGSAAEMQAETDWVRAQDLDAFKGKRPQLFEGEIEPNDLCQGAVGDCWLVAAFACASEFPDWYVLLYFVSWLDAMDPLQFIFTSPVFLFLAFDACLLPRNTIQEDSTRCESTIRSRRSLSLLLWTIGFLAKREQRHPDL